MLLKGKGTYCIKMNIYRFMAMKSKLSIGKSFVVLLGNKCDLDKKRAVSTQQVLFKNEGNILILLI